MKNRLKTLIYFLGSFIAAGIAIRIMAFIPNKIFDDVSNYLYIPTLGIFLGYAPLSIATEIALEITENVKNTRRIIIVIYSILALLIISMGILNLGGRIYLDFPIFEFLDEEDDLNHWLYYFPYGFSLIYSLSRIQKEGN